MKGNSTHNFFPPEGETNALILYNESDKRSEAIINLIMKKTSDTVGEINPFLKIKINLDKESLLGVIVGGSIVFYQSGKNRKTGANKYKINSSQFEIAGKPRLNIEKEYESK